MAHIPASAAIFSPSVARLASSTAKDWNYIDSWLSSKFHGRSAPQFERNADTLKALVALVALNETADEDRALVNELEDVAIQGLAKSNPHQNRKPQPNESQNQNNMVEPPGDELVSVATSAGDALTAISNELPREGQIALNSMAATAVELGVAYPELDLLGCHAMELQACLFQLEQVITRVSILHKHIEAELAKSDGLERELDSDTYRATADLARANLELQRKVKAATSAAADKHARGTVTGTSPAGLSVKRVLQEEQLYLELLAQKNTLDAHVHSFQGLPPDKTLARRQLETLRTELQTAIHKRDVTFEGLVERETPRKHR